MRLVGLQPLWPALLSLGLRFESRSEWLLILGHEATREEQTVPVPKVNN